MGVACNSRTGHLKEHHDRLCHLQHVRDRLGAAHGSGGEGLEEAFNRPGLFMVCKFAGTPGRRFARVKHNLRLTRGWGGARVKRNLCLTRGLPPGRRMLNLCELANYGRFNASP